MLSLYIVTLNNSENNMMRYRLVTEKQSLAIAKARELAGVDADAEFSTCQKTENVDHIYNQDGSEVTVS